MNNSKALLSIVAVAVFLCVPGVARAQTFYVATNGNDANPGTLSAPWRTVQKAANTLTAGQTANIRGGTYAERVTFSRSGSAGSPITLKAYPGEKPIIDAGYTKNSADNLIAAVEINARSYITLDGLAIRRGVSTDVHIVGASVGVTIQNCELTDFVTGDNAAAIYVDGESATDDLLIQNNTIHDRILDIRTNIGNGIIVFNAIDVTIQNNHIYNLVHGIYYKHIPPGHGRPSSATTCCTI